MKLMSQEKFQKNLLIRAWPSLYDWLSIIIRNYSEIMIDKLNYKIQSMESIKQHILMCVI